jgi:hypothetical protein
MVTNRGDNVTDVLTKPSGETSHHIEGDPRARDLGDQASAVASGSSANVPASYLFDPTRGSETKAAYLFDPTRGSETKAAYLFDPTRGSETKAAYLFDPTRGSETKAAYLLDPTRGSGETAASLDLKRWARTKGLSAASA